MQGCDESGLNDELQSVLPFSKEHHTWRLMVCSAIVAPSGMCSYSSRQQTGPHAGGILTSGAASREDLPADCMCCSLMHLCHVRKL